jgi:hypothetical protein
MSEFLIKKGEKGKTPQVEIPSNLDSKFFVMGRGNIIGKSTIQEFFTCTGALVCNDIPILKRTKSYAEAISALILKLERRFVRTHPTLQRLFYELPVINNPRAKKIASLIHMNEFDYIVQEAREIFDFYNMNHEHPVIDEILYDEDYLLRHLFCDNHTFDENTKKEVPPLHIIQQVFNGINKQYSWIVKGNQQGF